MSNYVYLRVLQMNDSNTLCESSFSASSDGSTQLDTLRDIGEIFNLRTTSPNYHLIGFFDIDNLHNEIIDLRLVMERCLRDILVIEETKLHSGFKTDLFNE